AQPAETVLERLQEPLACLARSRRDEADACNTGGSNGWRTRHCRACDDEHELAPPHAITRSPHRPAYSSELRLLEHGSLRRHCVVDLIHSATRWTVSRSKPKKL